jgi:Caspase domain
MQMVRVAVWVVLLTLLSSVVRAQEPARLALVIGNQDYVTKVGPLKNPRNDATLIEGALKQLGFKVTVLKDASYKAMDSALKRYVTEVHRAGRNALSFFYYSGHGVANPETQINYLIPVDVSDADDDKVWFESFQQNTIIDLLSRQAPNATHYVVFDACRNELNIAGAAAKALGTDKGFVPVSDTAGLLIAYATAPRKTASDIGDGGGPYAKALAEELLKPGIEAVTMFRNVQLKVKQTIGQDPWLSFPSLPAVYFAGVRPPENEETTLWVSVKDSKNPTVLNKYLERYPSGEFASLARALIEHYERQLQVEQAAREEERRRQEEVRKSAEVKRLEEESQRREATLGQERQRAEEAKNFAEARRVEEQQRAEMAARTEGLRNALETVRAAREAAAAAEEHRLAALKAAEEVKERANTTGLASPIREDVARDREALTRTLKSELARVGCDPGAVDGRWGAKAIEALRQFNRHAKVSLSVDKPTEDALRAIAVIKHPVCILRCAAHQKVSGGRCVSAKPEQPAAKAGGSTKLCWPEGGRAGTTIRECTGDPRERPIN